MDDQGWVPIKLIAGFKKVLLLTDNIQLIMDAVRTSPVVEVQGDKIRRNNWIGCCDGRTELISHADKLLQTCEAIDTDDDDDVKEKILKLGICVLHGSEKVAAKELLSRITLAVSKLKNGTNTEDILNDDNHTSNSSGSSGNGNAAMDTTDDEGPSKHLNAQKGTQSFRYQSELLKLDAEFDKAMEDLEKSQKYEYKLAEESLHTHKKYLLNISQQLDKEKYELASESDTSCSSVLLQTVEKRNENLKRELFLNHLTLLIQHGLTPFGKFCMLHGMILI
ncbi:unnamed protein product [Vicia faba]|uniref:HTH La-type RNA-binding domain-containing protein n=1 Tax=Vicia faba TaxID=3906 RepID=A0AAV0Z4A4_VICFA|nr:unnamed protein product [Vicia faba]